MLDIGVLSGIVDDAGRQIHPLDEDATAVPSGHKCVGPSAKKSH